MCIISGPICNTSSKVLAGFLKCIDRKPNDIEVLCSSEKKSTLVCNFSSNETLFARHVYSSVTLPTIFLYFRKLWKSAMNQVTLFVESTYYHYPSVVYIDRVIS